MINPENIRFHGNGFFQYVLPDLNKRFRLHVWSPWFPPIENHNALVHTHRFDMKSHVLLGTLRHKTYDWVSASMSLMQHQHKLYTVKYHEKENATFHPCGAGRLDLRHEYEMNFGSTYTFGADLFHTSEPAGETGILVTLIEKTHIIKELDPLLAVAADVTVDNITHAYAEDQRGTGYPTWEEAQTVIMCAYDTCRDDIERIIAS